jgi:acylphosphatase
MEADRQQREVYYSGRVQGIGFRYTARSLATGGGVTGFVRNLPDGRVHLVVEGEKAEVEKFLDAIRAEMGYYIDKVDAMERPASGRFQIFEIRH